MVPKEAYECIHLTFSQIEEAVSLKMLDAVIDEAGLREAYLKFFKKYPSVKPSLTVDELNVLKNEGLIDESNRLLLDKFATGTPTVKLLYSLLWKQGDANKLQHLVDGILNSSIAESDHTLILRQFGRNLASAEEPIVDQHVLRAFEIFQLKSFDEKAVQALRKKGVYKRTDENLLTSYKKWLYKSRTRFSTEDLSPANDMIDKILFLIGKRVKT